MGIGRTTAATAPLDPGTTSPLSGLDLTPFAGGAMFVSQAGDLDPARSGELMDELRPAGLPT